MSVSCSWAVFLLLLTSCIIMELFTHKQKSVEVCCFWDGSRTNTYISSYLKNSTWLISTKLLRTSYTPSWLKTWFFEHRTIGRTERMGPT